MKIEILHNGQVVETRDLAEGSYKIGRAPECEIVLKSPQVSKQHALLVIKADKAAIVDTGSANGIFVNGILVKKQRFGSDDVIDIVDHRIRMAKAVRPKLNARVGGQRPITLDGNAALDLDSDQDFQAQPQSAVRAEKELTPQEKLVDLMDNKILVFFYGMIRTTDYRLVLASILIVTMVGSVLASVTPILSWGKEITKKESLSRAHTVLTQMVRENYRVLNKSSDTSRLSVEGAERAEGILSAYVIDAKTKSILAPAKLLNKSINDPYALLAINDAIDGKENLVSKDKGEGVFVVAQAIPYYGPPDNGPPSEEASGTPMPVAIVLAYFQVPSSIDSTWEPLSVAALISLCLSLVAFYLIFKMISHPVSQLSEQLDSALKGEDIQITCDAKFPELQTLATVINFSVGRLKQGGGGMAMTPSNMPGGMDADAEETLYLKTIEEFCFGTSDGVLVLNRDKKVKFVSKVLEDLLSLRTQYAFNQNIGDACRDGSFAGTVIDLAEQVVTSLGESQTATLDINGVARNLVAVGHRFPNGDIAFIVITVKMNG